MALQRASGTSAAQFRAVRESLGVGGDWLGRVCGVAQSAVSQWESGSVGISAARAARLAELVAFTDQYVDQLVRFHREHPDLPLTTPGVRDASKVIFQGHELPGSWHRAVCLRVQAQLPWLTVVYESDADQQLLDLPLSLGAAS